jgi:hypothetical protein
MSICIHNSFYVSHRQEEVRLRISSKRGSTTAHQAMIPINLMKRHLFWTSALPIGIRHVAIDKFTDTDEAGLFLQTTNRNEGKAYINARVTDFGPYGHDEKWTLILTVDSSGFLHYRFQKEAGTTKAIFAHHLRLQQLAHLQMLP